MIASRRLLHVVPVLAAAAFAAAAHAATLPPNPVRPVVSFDQDWRFSKGDASGASAAAFDDSAWTQLNVPHDWPIEGPFQQNAITRGAGAFAPSGVVWYRKSFATPANAAGKRLFIDFDGVMQNSDVYINGFKLGHRPYGYVSFQYELTGHLNTDGKPNVISVRADTAAQPASRWYNGGGIYRHVRLEIANPVHIDNWGTFVTTPKITRESATVHVRSTVINQSSADKSVSLQVTLLGPDGKSVGTAETKPQAVPAGKTVDFDQDLAVASPKLWNLDDTSMYTAVAAVRDGATTIDDQAVPFGIRTIEFKPATGFWLNGQNMKLKGACLHSDAGALGIAVPEDEWIYRFKKLKEFGYNAIRTAHNPVSPEFLDACDKVGIVVMDEMFDCWLVAKNPQDYHLYFNEWNQIDTRDTVRRDRNHPSIILYSAGNEIHDTPQPARAIPILQGLVKTFHENDPTRPVTQALFRPNQDGNGGAYNNGLADLLDVVGTNYRDNEIIAAQRAKPTISIVGTENNKDLNAWSAVRDNPGYAGHFIWTGIDYLGESRTWPTIGNSAGVLDINARPKADAYQRASWLSDKPFVAVVRAGGQIATGNANPDEPQARFTATVDWTPANLDPHPENIQVFSNCDEVEVYLNDVSQGKQARGQRDATRNGTITFAPGTLKAVGRNAGKDVATFELKTAGKASKIVLDSSTDNLFADFDSMAHITASITDDKGVTVPGANDQITFKITGPGKIAALAGGALSPQNFRGESHFAYMGQLAAYLQATKSGEPITLTASAPGLAPATLTLKTAPARPGR